MLGTEGAKAPWPGPECEGRRDEDSLLIRLVQTIWGTTSCEAQPYQGVCFIDFAMWETLAL